MTTTTEGQTAESQTLRRLNAAVELFRGLQNDMSSQTITVFLIVATAPDSTISMVDLADRLDMSQAATSRNVALLGKINRKKEPGLDLVKWELDPQDFRRKVVTLTAKGQRFAARLSKMLSEGQEG